MSLMMAAGCVCCAGGHCCTTEGEPPVCNCFPGVTPDECAGLGGRWYSGADCAPDGGCIGVCCVYNLDGERTGCFENVSECECQDMADGMHTVNFIIDEADFPQDCFACDEECNPPCDCCVYAIFYVEYTAHIRSYGTEGEEEHDCTDPETNACLFDTVIHEYGFPGDYFPVNAMCDGDVSCGEYTIADHEAYLASLNNDSSYAYCLWREETYTLHIQAYFKARPCEQHWDFFTGQSSITVSNSGTDVGCTLLNGTTLYGGGANDLTIPPCGT